MSDRSWARMGMALVILLGIFGCATVDRAAVGTAPPAEDPAAGGALGSYLAGRHAQQEHDYGRAADYMLRALADDPDNPELMQRAFLLSLSQGRMDEALSLARRVAVLDPKVPIAQLVVVLDRVKARDYHAAQAEAAKLPKIGAQQFAVPLVTAWIDVGLGQVSDGIAALAPLGQTKGLDTLRDFHQAMIADLAGRPEEAEPLYQKLVAGSQRVNWRVVEMLGNFDERNGKKAAARALYQRFAVETHQEELVAPGLKRIAEGVVPARRVANARDGTAEALFDLASLLNQKDTMDLALLYARLALDLRPDFPLAELLTAEIHEAEDRNAEALAAYRAVNPASSFSWSARLKAASELNALDRTDEAATELKAMAAERPHDAQPLIELADMLRARSRFAEAVTVYDAALDRLGTTIEPRDWTLFYSRGVALERSGQWPRAEADFEHALELEPDQPLVLNYLGYSWIEKGIKLPQAMRMVQRAAELRPNDGYIVDSLGWAYYQLGDFSNAAHTLERAIELLPEDATINDHLGDAYWQVGRQAEARYQWRRALQFKPEADQAKTIDAKLDRGLAKPAAAASGG